MSGYVAGDDVFGGAASLVTNFENSPNITITGYAESDSVATLFIEPSFGKFGKPYWDFVYNLNKEQANWEIGWTKKIAEIDTQSKLLIGFGYRENKIALDRTFSVFVWIHS